MLNINQSQSASVSAIEGGSSPTMRRTTILFLFALQFPIAGWIFTGQSLSMLLGGECIYWGLTLLIIFYVLQFERRPLSSIGLTIPTWRSAVFGMFGAIITVALMALIYLVVIPAFRLPADEPQMATLTALPIWFRCLLIARAALFEEILYRGFAIERLTELTGRRWLAAALSVIAFTYMHLAYWGWTHLLIAAAGGLVFTTMYLWRRDLSMTITAHALTDIVGLILA